MTAYQSRMLPPRSGWRRVAAWPILLGPGLVFTSLAQSSSTPDAEARDTAAQVVAVQGTNWWVAPSGAEDWVLAASRVPQSFKAGDRLRTGPHTRLFLRTPHLGVVQVPPRTTLQISEPPPEKKSTGFKILKGMLYFFHRGTPEDLEIHSRSASAAVRGTEFVAEALDDGGLVIDVIHGEVALSNDRGTVVLNAGEKGVAAPGREPTRSPIVEVANTIQWFLYYPAVIDLNELQLTSQERVFIEDSVRCYEQGDLLQALSQYPRDREPESARERIYLAALLLAVGEVAQAEGFLAKLPGPDVSDNRSPPAERLAGALRSLIATVKQQPQPVAAAPGSASEGLAESYHLQSQARLPDALIAARRAVQQSPHFGFAWARVAELEFSFGRIDAALEAMERALALTPRHSQAVAMKGFLLSAKNDISAALRSFEEALAMDSGLGNAWLGRGLCRIRRGDIRAGLEDLEVAAAVEPQRALLRSYLSKAFSSAGDLEQARREIELAKEMDSHDPTAWLYSALLHRQDNEINAGVRDLETSKTLNDERRIYRSRHLLDEDRAVRGANLAALYRDAGMLDLSRREAADAVNTDYANYSAHLFLANSYNELRDPGQLDLRYETPWFNEYLLANLLAPVGAGTLSQNVSAQEFSRLFERDGLGVASLTEYSSNGDWVQSGSQYGRFGNSAYAFDADYRTANGQRLNNDLEQLTLSVQFKQQLGLRDSLFLQAIYYDAAGGDLTRVYDPDDTNAFQPNLRFEETQEPLLLAGYHHEWSPRQHTLFLAGRLHDRLNVSNPGHPTLIVSKDPDDMVTGTTSASTELNYRSKLEIYSGEIQHIAMSGPHTFVLGTRFQFGDFETESRQQNLTRLPAALPEPLVQDGRQDFQRLTAYGYYHWQVAEPLLLIAGLSYDRLEYPANHRFAPILDDELTDDQISPKAGLVLTPTRNTTLRAAYSRSLGGVSLDQSVRLEPSQVAGFNQAWRSLIPESAAGSQAAARFETWSVEWDQRFPGGTYFALRGQILKSDADRMVGVFDLPFFAEPSVTPEHLDFEERSVSVVLNQLIGAQWSAGASYRFSQAELDDVFPDIPENVPHAFGFQPRQELKATLHQVNLFALYNHPCGVFAGANALWSRQSNEGYAPDRPGDDFWQLNFHAGYRFPKRRAEIWLGVLNVTDQDYHLNPLNLTPEVPRDRTFTASLRFNF